MKIEICPVCGSPIEHIELTTLPPIPIKQCLACDWRWEGKQEAVEYVMFKDEAAIKVKKAIDLLSEKRNLTRKLQEGWKNAEYCPPEETVGSAGLFYNQHKEYADALDLALTALRSMPEAGEPLSLQQLREMDGKPVWVEFEDGSGGLWGIVHISIFEQIVFPDGLHCTIGQLYYGKIYKAYSYPPVHIDREMWNDCVCNEFEKTCCTCVSMECHTCVNQSKYEQGRYCSNCGRPLTEVAWAELERRLRGQWA